MAAPESSPELTVVPKDAERGEQTTARETPTEAQTPRKPGAAAKPSAPPPLTAPQAAESRKTGRRGAPWWLVVVVAVIGLLLFLDQYQRAEGLDARVGSLTAELASADAQLQIAQDRIAAHENHLERVRTGIASLSDQVAGLRALADRDPLAPAPETGADAPAAAPQEPAPSSGAQTDADGYYWRADAPSTSAVGAGDPGAAIPDGERQAIVEGALGTPFSDRADRDPS